jgi:hypothetical protein
VAVSRSDDEFCAAVLAGLDVFRIPGHNRANRLDWGPPEFVLRPTRHVCHIETSLVRMGRTPITKIKLPQSKVLKSILVPAWGSPESKNYPSLAV